MHLPVLVAILACSTPSEGPASPPSGAPVAAEVTAPQPPVRRKDVRALSYPAGWLAERLGGERVAVTVVIPPGADPPAWQPPPELVASLADADLVVAVGAGYEAWTATAALKPSTFSPLADALDLIVLEGKVHRHGKGGEHSHAGKDPHVWMDPTLVVAQAEVLHAALVRLDPEGRPTFDAALDALRTDATALDDALAGASKALTELRFAANHPSFNYLARRYGLQIATIDLDPETLPGPDAVAAVAAWKATAGARAVLLWEASPTPEVKAALPAGIEHVALDPLEQPWPGGYDWLGQARGNAMRLQRLSEPEAP